MTASDQISPARKLAAKARDLRLDFFRDLALLARNETITVVAIGSSSTGGAGASAPEFSHPSQLVTLWPQLVGGWAEVHNRGINGQDILQMNERLRADAVEIRPDLVLWQLGTNDVLRSRASRSIAPISSAASPSCRRPASTSC